MIYKVTCSKYSQHYGGVSHEAHLIYRKDFNGYSLLVDHVANIDKLNEMRLRKNETLQTIY